MISKIFNIQKHIRDVASTAEDPTYVHTIISELVLKTFNLVILVIILGTIAFGALGFILRQPGWWIMFGIGLALSLLLLFIRWFIKNLIRRAVNSIHKTMQGDTINATVYEKD